MIWMVCLLCRDRLAVKVKLRNSSPYSSPPSFDSRHHPLTTLNMDPFDTINSLEDTHYTEGYKSGYDHGALHGIFEGRELGQEKCFEWWEELGYLEGQAMFWRRLGEVGQGGKKMTGR